MTTNKIALDIWRSNIKKNVRQIKAVAELSECELELG